jgi:hypothetical protein
MAPTNVDSDMVSLSSQEAFGVVAYLLFDTLTGVGVPLDRRVPALAAQADYTA